MGRIPLARLAELAVDRIPLALSVGLAVDRIPLALSVGLADAATASGCCDSRHGKRGVGGVGRRPGRRLL